jgi:hypothetical protein
VAETWEKVGLCESGGVLCLCMWCGRRSAPSAPEFDEAVDAIGLQQLFAGNVALRRAQNYGHVAHGIGCVGLGRGRCNVLCKRKRGLGA